jgi:hypothetical protein
MPGGSKKMAQGTLANGQFGNESSQVLHDNASG